MSLSHAARTGPNLARDRDPGNLWKFMSLSLMDSEVVTTVKPLA